MKLTQKAIQAILLGDVRAFICSGLDESYHTVQRWIRDNKVNGKLTTVAAVKIIKERTGLKESEILEQE